jgi:hypothetical protein
MTEEEDARLQCINCNERIEAGDECSCERDTLCEHCYDELAGSCEDCGDTYYREGLNSTPMGALCENCLENYGECDNCGHFTTRDNLHYSERNDNLLCDECYDEMDRGFAEKDMGKEVMGVTFKENKYHRKFGIELEAEEGNCSQLYDLLDEADNPWAITEDGSLNSTGVEVVSPKLCGDEGYKSIKETCAIMKKAGYETSTRAGLHVHFDFTKAVEDDIKKIVAAYYQYDEFFLRMLPKSRRNNHYCETLKSKMPYVVNCVFNSKLENIYMREGDKHSKYCNLRYSTLNIHSWYYRGTLEVRTHSSTLNAEKIIKWIEIHQRFFNYALGKPLNYWLFKKPSMKEWHNILGSELFHYYNERVREIQNKSKRVNNNDVKEYVHKFERFSKTLANEKSDMELFNIFNNNGGN